MAALRDVINNKITEQVDHFNYRGYKLSYNYDNDGVNKLSEFGHICRKINNSIRSKIVHFLRMKFYKTLAILVIYTLAYGSEFSVFKKHQESRMQGVEIRLLRVMKGCRLRNSVIRNELK